MNISEAKIIIQRTSQYANRARKIVIYINGQKAGLVKNGERKEFKVAVGTSAIYAKIDWCKTKPLSLHLHEGQTTFVELGSPLKGMKIFLSLWYVLFKANDWLYLKLL